jgi:hypothetical protein
MATSRNKAAGSACAVGILIVGLLLGTESNAQSEASAEDRAACTPDVFRLCSSEIPNVERIVACLQKDKARLSDKCRAVFNRQSANVASRTRSMRAASGPWCDFGKTEQAGVQQMWQTWCK